MQCIRSFALFAARLSCSNKKRRRVEVGVRNLSMCFFPNKEKEHHFTERLSKTSFILRFIYASLTRHYKSLKPQRSLHGTNHWISIIGHHNINIHKLVDFRLSRFLIMIKKKTEMISNVSLVHFFCLSDDEDRKRNIPITVSILIADTQILKPICIHRIH